jgi:hypothetical protein
VDRITANLLDQFCENFEIQDFELNKKFEYYTNHAIASSINKQTLDLENISIGKGGDTGIDGIIVVVNGQIIDSSAQIEEIIDGNQKISVKFVFIQAKSGEHFEMDEINNFGFGVKDLFSEESKLPRNADVIRYSQIAESILEFASEFNENPQCHLFFVTSGKPNPKDENHNAVISSVVKDLEDFNLFSQVDFYLLGAEDLNTLYRKSQNPIEAEFDFRNKINFENPLPNIKEVYFGVLPISEFKKIVLDENESLKPIFDDNVRDFQGESIDVNKNILETLKGRKPELFAVLNNGITIVAKEVVIVRSKFILKDYQIVNGCQTTNMLFNGFDFLKDTNIDIPVKIIITENEDIKNAITVATNSQIAVKREQLHAMTNFQKGLENFYKTFCGDMELFYERRSGQYRTDSKVIKSRIITLQNQIKAFSAMFAENPHRVTSYFGGVVKKQIESDPQIIFNPNHPFELYYASGIAFYRLESLFKRNEIDRKYKKVRFFILMIFRKLIQKEKLNLANIQSKKKAVEYCQPIIEILSDEEQTKKVFIQSIAVWDKAKIDLDEKEILKMASTTDKLKEELNK